MLRKAIDWILVMSAVRDARAKLAAEDQQTGAQLQQARLVAEVMRRVAEPAETLPPGNRAAVIMALAREAVASILAAQVAPPVTESGLAEPAAVKPPGEAAENAPPESWVPAGAAPAGAVPAVVVPGVVPAGAAGATRSEARLALAEALDRAPPERLLAAAPDVPTLGAIKEALLGVPALAGAEASEEEEKRAASVRAFVEALLWNADAPRRRVDQLLVFRFARLSLVAAVLLLVALGVYRLSLGTNLAAGKPFKTSSSWSGCATDSTCEGQLLFHTVEEKEPWVEYDLLKPQKIHRVQVKNRPDCCLDRILPLVVEVSLDGKQWTEVGRKTDEFATWNLKFPPRQARYVKLHIARVSALHIKELLIQ